MRLILAFIAVITASSALAAAGPSTATLAAPTTGTAITDDGTWRCTGLTCTGNSSPMLRQAVAVCAGVATTAGRIAAFTAAGYSFTDADLVRCNRHVKR